MLKYVIPISHLSILVFYLYKTDIVNIFPADSTRTFIRLPTFYFRFKSS